MEWVAWASHIDTMHGFGWAWRRDHHEPHDRALENDLCAIGRLVASHWMGLGVLVYGVIYTAVHKSLVHQRYFRVVPKRLVQAHKLYHATIGREGGVSFGFLLAARPDKLKAELRRQREAGLARVRESAGA